MSAPKAVRAVYGAVPDIACKGLCAARACSGGIAANPVERAAAMVDLLPLAHGDSGERCPALTILNRCAVYDDRPLICRLWGVSEVMPCPYGCVPDQGHLSRADSADLVMQMVDVAGEAT